MLSNNSSSSLSAEVSSVLFAAVSVLSADVFKFISLSVFGSTSGVSASKLLFFGADKSISSILLSSF